MDMVKDIKAEKVFTFFEEINQIPRESGNEAGVINYLKKFAEERKLKVELDKINNVFISKPASKGREQEEWIAFQAHMDMICEKNEDSKHDFEKDPITSYVEGDWIKAKGTTLGADNGIGVALILALLDESTNHPPLQGIFTVEEETTMIGSIEIDSSKVKAKQIISLDGANEGEILIGSANCNEWKGIIRAEKQKETEERENYELNYQGFLGGHSGGNIGEEKRGNPFKLLAEALSSSELKGIRIQELSGGSRVNVIPREAKLLLTIPKQEAKDKIKKLENILIKQEKKYEGSKISLQKQEENKKVNETFTEKDSQKVIDFLSQFKNGALAKEEDNVILSANLAAVRTEKEGIVIEFSERSNRADLEKKFLTELAKNLEEQKIEIIWHQELKGVEPKPNSPLLTKCKKVYQEITQKEIKEVITQGVVEGGFFTSKMPDCEYVAIGPDTIDVHSPKERLSISSTQRVWEYIVKLIQ